MLAKATKANAGHLHVSRHACTHLLTPPVAERPVRSRTLCDLVQQPRTAPCELVSEAQRCPLQSRA